MNMNHLADRRNDYSIHYRTWHNETDEHATQMVDFHRRQLGPYLPLEREACSVLDVGCGMGFALLTLKQLGFTRIRGIDIDESQVKACLNKNLFVELVDNTVSFLRQYREEFDLVLLLDVLEHIPVQEQIGFMQAIYDCLKPSGRVILQVPNATSILASRQRYIDHTHCCSFTEHSLSYVIKCAGFHNIIIPKQPEYKHSTKEMWLKAPRDTFRRWLIRFIWRQILISELGRRDYVLNISLELDLLAVAYKAVSSKDSV